MEDMVMLNNVDPNFWKDRKVFLTGHTGFKGGWLSIWLSSMGANVKGYALEPSSEPNLFNLAKIENIVLNQFGDIRNYELLKSSLKKFSPEIVIHMAAQPLVRDSYEFPRETYYTNVMGTVNILDSIKKLDSVKAFINVTTDKCYENLNEKTNFKETDPMGGHDPYSSSKGCSELVTSAYRRSFFELKRIGIASARAGNVIGGGDWSKDRLIPDILNNFSNNQPVIIRNPSAIRPWQHVLESLSGYLILAQELYNDPSKYSQPWNFGPEDKDAKSVESIIEIISKSWPGSTWKKDTLDNPYESQYLKLDISKTIKYLKWKPKWSLDKSIEKIVQWHHNFSINEDVHELCLKDIKTFVDSH